MIESMGECIHVGETLLAYEVTDLEGGGSVTQTVFALLGELIGNPKCQTFILCSPWDPVAKCVRPLLAELSLALPLTVRFDDRESPLIATARCLATATSDTIAKTLCLAGGTVHARVLTYGRRG